MAVGGGAGGARGPTITTERDALRALLREATRFRGALNRPERRGAGTGYVDGGRLDRALEDARSALLAGEAAEPREPEGEALMVALLEAWDRGLGRLVGSDRGTGAVVEAIRAYVTGRRDEREGPPVDE